MTNRTHIGSTVTEVLPLGFETIFPDERPLTPEGYLKGGSRDFILKVAAFFLGFKPYNSKYNDKQELLRAFFSPENDEFSREIYDKINAIEKRGKKIEIINAYSSLKLFEYFFAIEEKAETQTSAEFERNLFKAYLVLNSEFLRSQNIAISSIETLNNELRIPMMMFCGSYPISDKVNYDISQIWTTQMIKAIYLFQFLETHEKIQPLLKAFLEYFNSPTWQDYLKSMLPLTTPAIKNKNEAHTDISVTPGEKFEEGCAFIEKLIVQDSEKLDENDFLTLRAKPFYKVKNGVYRIIFNLFAVEKIFKGVYFLLRDVNNKLPNGQKLPGLKSVYCYEFSEQTLLYQIMDIIYPNKDLKFSGKQLADMRVNGAPDYYIRKGKNILILESKDFLISADKKSSFDFNIYENEFARILYYEELPNGKKKAGAVMQLINTIKVLLKNEFKADKDYYYRDVFIYPILITHDHQYDVPGFNNLINYWFQGELEILKDEGLFIHHVKALTVVNIDSLIYHQVGLAEDIPLHEILNAYQKYVELEPAINFGTSEEYKAHSMSKLIPFSFFIDNYFHERHIIKPPKILELIVPALFNDKIEKA